MKNFFRKVAFGLKPDEKAPSDPCIETIIGRRLFIQ